MRADMRVELCVDMCVDMCVDLCADAAALIAHAMIVHSMLLSSGRCCESGEDAYTPAEDMQRSLHQYVK